MNKKKKPMKNEIKIALLICITTIFALTDNLTLIFLKLVGETVVMGALWVIIEAVKYIKSLFKEPKPNVVIHKQDIDTRPIPEQLREAYEKKKK